MDTTGILTLIATPIGNLGDIAPRAVAALRDADVVYCEDTRHSRQLLTHLEIRGQKLVSLHAGQTVALISDAGMPVVSDPGQRLVAAVAAAGHRITAIPGPTAVTMALALSGLPSQRFRFEGFLPTRGSARSQRLAAVAQSPDTTILYESPQRLNRTLADLLAATSVDRQVVITRELTKLHETVWRGTLAEAQQLTDSPRGEYALVLAGASSQPDLITDEQITTRLRFGITAGASRRSAVDQVSTELNLPRKQVYALALLIKP